MNFGETLETKLPVIFRDVVALVLLGCDEGLGSMQRHSCCLIIDEGAVDEARTFSLLEAPVL